MRYAFKFWLKNYLPIPAFGLVILAIGLIKFPQDKPAIAAWLVIIVSLALITLIYCLIKKRGNYRCYFCLEIVDMTFIGTTLIANDRTGNTGMRKQYEYRCPKCNTLHTFSDKL
jgi:hypothetical protein